MSRNLLYINGVSRGASIPGDTTRNPGDRKTPGFSFWGQIWTVESLHGNNFLPSIV